MVGATGRMQVKEEMGGEEGGRVNVEKTACALGQAVSRRGTSSKRFGLGFLFPKRKRLKVIF